MVGNDWKNSLDARLSLPNCPQVSQNVPECPLQSHRCPNISHSPYSCSRKRAVLFATDVASRGLDFPSVNWVVQMDCPEDVDAYIHRAGRTARYEDGGEALLMLTVHEEKGTSVIKTSTQRAFFFLVRGSQYKSG